MSARRTNQPSSESQGAAQMGEARNEVSGTAAGRCGWSGGMSESGKCSVVEFKIDGVPVDLKYGDLAPGGMPSGPTREERSQV